MGVCERKGAYTADEGAALLVPEFAKAYCWQAEKSPNEGRCLHREKKNAFQK
jgi:hypothetical protein